MKWMGACILGEMTFFHGYGMEEYRPESFEYEMGGWIALPGEKA